jgi:molecular chaperone GrpE (heat shock protein)
MSKNKISDSFIMTTLETDYPEIFKEIINKANEKHKNTNSKDSEANKNTEQAREIFENSKEILELMKQNAQLITKNKELQDKLNSLTDEFRSFIKKSEIHISEAKQQAIKKFATEIISIVSVIDLAKQSCQHDANILIGIEMLEKQFFDVLGRFHITKVNLQIGDQFDENYCEAIDREAVHKGHTMNTISKIISYPFKINNDLLVNGRVIVYC